MSSRQATVERWAADGGGWARADDGTRFALPAGLLAGSAQRLLRVGQRVHVELSEGVAVDVRLPGAQSTEPEPP